MQALQAGELWDAPPCERRDNLTKVRHLLPDFDGADERAPTAVAHSRKRASAGTPAAHLFDTLAEQTAQQGEAGNPMALLLSCQRNRDVVTVVTRSRSE